MFLHIGCQNHKFHCVERKNKAIAYPKKRPAELLIMDSLLLQQINP